MVLAMLLAWTMERQMDSARRITHSLSMMVMVLMDFFDDNRQRPGIWRWGQGDVLDRICRGVARCRFRFQTLVFVEGVYGFQTSSYVILLLCPFSCQGHYSITYFDSLWFQKPALDIEISFWPLESRTERWGSFSCKARACSCRYCAGLLARIVESRWPVFPKTEEDDCIPSSNKAARAKGSHVDPRWW